MKFSEFAKQNNESESLKKTQEASNETSQQTIENLYEKYKDMSQSELMENLMKQVNQQKQNGSFDFEKIQQSINLILPYLSEEQRNNILNLLGGLK